MREECVVCVMRECVWCVCEKGGVCVVCVMREECA